MPYEDMLMMPLSTYTPWYPADQYSPTRVGWYEVKHCGEVRRYWWDGGWWLHAPEPRRYAWTYWHSSAQWRGLTRPGDE